MQFLDFILISLEFWIFRRIVIEYLANTSNLIFNSFISFLESGGLLLVIFYILDFKLPAFGEDVDYLFWFGIFLYSGVGLLLSAQNEFREYSSGAFLLLWLKLENSLTFLFLFDKFLKFEFCLRSQVCRLNKLFQETHFDFA